MYYSIMKHFPEAACSVSESILGSFWCDATETSHQIPLLGFALVLDLGEDWKGAVSEKAP